MCKELLCCPFPCISESELGGASNELNNQLWSSARICWASSLNYLVSSFCLSVCRGIGVTAKCEKLEQSNEKSSCQKNGPRLGSLQRGSQNSMGIEATLAIAEEKLPGCQLYLHTALTSQCTSGWQWRRTCADGKSSTPVMTMSCP